MNSFPKNRNSLILHLYFWIHFMKKIFLLFSLCSLLFALTKVTAYNSADVSNANFLAEKGLIVAQSTAAGYRLDDTITRAEVVGIALKIKWIVLPEDYQCKKYFLDTLKNDWVCRAVELSSDIELVSRINKKFRPQDKITRAEALAIIYKSWWISASLDGNNLFTEEWEKWQKELAYKIYNSNLEIPQAIKNEISWLKWSPNNYATRADIFAFGSQILWKEVSNISKNIGSNISVIDGDTINFDNLKIRMIWLDAPESNNSRYWYSECFGKESKEHLESLVWNKNNITLEVDSSQWELDMYGRTLAYVMIDGVNINAKMIADGFGFEETYNNKIYKYQNEHKNAELNAKNNSLGLWSSATCWWNRKKWTPIEQNNTNNNNTINVWAYSCGTKTYCSQMITCEEAKYFLNQCGLTRLDSDSDGIPCEAVCN